MTRTAPKLGRAPFQPRRKRLNARAFVERGYSPPAVCDHASLVPEWPGYANERYGDCVWASIGHAVQSLTYYGGVEYKTLSERELLTAYSAVTGFDPYIHGEDNPTDKGTVVADALSYWRKAGIAGDQIRAYAYVHKAFAAYAAGIDIFGFLNVGIQLPRYAWKRFEQGADHWDLPTARDSQVNEGGHSIHVAGYDANAQYFLAVTWGQLIKVSWDFLHRYADEAWVVITDDWLDQWGRTPRGLDLAALGANFERLTGEPSPVAGRRLRPRDPDRVLWSDVGTWSSRTHRGDAADVAASLRTWAAAQGLD
jgi:hypothetical protein